MAGSFQRLIHELARRLPSLKGEAHADWGSAHPNARSAIRTSLAGSLLSANSSERGAVLELTHPPHLIHWSVSVSHAREFGGWMAVPRPTQIGWDVETEARIRPATVERICADREIDEAPRAAYLWCAKEAFYKALEDFQPLVVSDLTITSWREREGFWAWQGLGPHNGRGLLLAADGLIFSACIVPE